MTDKQPNEAEHDSTVPTSTTQPAEGEATTPPAETAPAEQDKSAPARGIMMTERAATEIRRVIAEHGLPDDCHVRLGAKGGGCSGFSYVLDFDKNGPTEFDLTYEQHGVSIVIDKKSEFFMGGTTLDFNDGLLDRGFVFQNPQASGTCGCGTSFSA